MPFNTQPPWNVTTFLNVAASRNFGTGYTNTTGKTMFVLISFNHVITAAIGAAYVIVNSPIGVQLVAQAGIWAGVQDQAHKSTIMFVVQPGNDYFVQATAVDGYNTIAGWFEIW
jgi:hypothetical protein